MATTLQALSRLQLFSELEEPALESIAPYMHERRCFPGQVIICEGEPCQTAWFVAEGLVRASRLSLEGREQVLAYLGPGEPLNLVSALDSGHNPATVVTVTDTTLCAIPCDRFWRIMYHHQEVTQAALKRLATEVRRLSDMVEDLALHTVRTRLARFLLAQGGGRPTRQRWTQEEIAVQIGTVREIVGRTLRAFADEGLIRRERGRVVLADREALDRAAGRLSVQYRPDRPLGASGFRQIPQEALKAAGRLAPAASRQSR